MPRRLERVELAEEDAGVDDDAVADDVDDVRVQDARSGTRRTAKLCSPTTMVWPALWPPW